MGVEGIAGEVGEDRVGKERRRWGSHGDCSDGGFGES